MTVAMEGTREFCIEMYVTCQQTAKRGLPLRRCQPCMDRCLVDDDYRWPDGKECQFE